MTEASLVSERYPEGYYSTRFEDDLAVVSGHLSGEADTLDLDAGSRLEAMVDGFRPTFYKVALGFEDVSCLTLDDFAQEAVFGLFDALSRINSDKQPRQFVAYAKLRMYDFMFRQSAAAGGLITLSEGSLKRIIKAARINRELEAVPASADREAYLDELLAEEVLGRKPYQLACRSQALMNPLILDEEYSGGLADSPHASELYYAMRRHNRSVVVDNLSGAEDRRFGVPDTCVDPAELITNPDAEEELDFLKASLERLTTDRADMVVQYFGVFGNKRKDQAELAKEHGVSASRISQRLSEATAELMVEMLVKLQETQAIEAVIDNLEPRDRDIMVRFWGLRGFEAIDIEAIGKVFGKPADYILRRVSKCRRRVARQLPAR